MKRSCVAGAVLTCGLAGSALAADMPIKAPPVPRVVSDWTGFYIGIHGGYGWARPSISDFDLNQSNPNSLSGAEPSLPAPKLRGAVFGGHAGYNWQWGQRGVVGLEIDYSAANLKSTQEVFVDADAAHIETRTLQSKLDGLASTRARVGFLVGPEFLLYGTGGAAWGHTKFTDTDALSAAAPGEIFQVNISRAGANHFGWVAGAGGEWKLWDTGVMLRVEYLHYDFGSASLAFDTTITTTNNGAHFKGDSFNVPLGRLTTDVVRGGLSYKF
jgi:opacity protein-like surface antigen